jgi:hypothetical protein
MKPSESTQNQCTSLVSLFDPSKHDIAMVSEAGKSRETLTSAIIFGEGHQAVTTAFWYNPTTEGI